MPALYLSLAIMFEVIGTITLKWSANSPSIINWIIIIAAYSLSFILLWFSLKTLPLGLAYATWSGIGISITAIAGIFLFNEKIDTIGFIGIAFIIIGIVLINTVSSMSGH